MIRVSVYYPNSPDKKFDLDYYSTKHMGMVSDRLTPLGLVKWDVDKGLAGGTPADPAPFVAIGHIYFNSVDEFQKAFPAHAPEILADIPNFTDIEPQFQVSEVIG
ncbi:MAG: EthD family reductase [Phycisphaerae bacterium]